MVIVYDAAQKHYSQWPKDRNNPAVHQQTDGSMKCDRAHKTEYYSASKGNEIMTYATTQMNLEDIVM